MRELCSLVHADRDDEDHARIVADPDFFYPDARAVTPRAVQLSSTITGESVSIALGPRRAVEVGAALRGGPGPHALIRLLADTTAHLRAHGLARPLARGPVDPQPLYIGHACVTWTDGEQRLWCDPFLPPRSPRYPRRYQPLGPLDFPERSHVVAFTHSHPDHFDPASLLLFPTDTLFLVPDIPRESLLSVDLALRLRQLGFERIETLPWWSRRQLGAFEISALPFHGEQPLGSGGEALAEYNRGNTYAVRDPHGRLTLLLADSGADPRSTVQQYARRLRSELGRVDTVFANHRRWRLHPPQYLLTSVPQYLCHVPTSELGVRQQIMMEPDELAALAETLQARHVVPYAMGGARWHEELGLGFDHLTPRTATDFDASPHELTNTLEGQRGITLRRSFTPVVLAAGQRLDADGTAALTPGLQLPAADEWAPQRTFPAHPCWSVHGPAVTPALIGQLAALTTLDPAAFLISSPGFCEVHSSPGQPGEFLRVMLARYLAPLPAILARRARPLTGEPFNRSRRWSARYREAHALAFHALRGEAPFPQLRRICASLGPTPPALLAELQRHLLAGEPPPAKTPPAKTPPAKTPPGKAPRHVRRARRWTRHAHPILPPIFAGLPAAAPLVARHGPAAVLRALTIVRLLHNMYLTTCSMGQPPAASEAAFFAAVLAPMDTPELRPPSPEETACQP